MRFIITAVCFLLLTSLQARVEVRQFDRAELEQRYKVLVHELRCLVCQNQNLADSNSDLAKDMRNKVEELINKGKSDQDVIDYMVARYGDFVLYRPPFKATTVLLWLGPFIFLAIAVIILLRIIRQRTRAENTVLDANDHERAQKLLQQQEEE